jgi:hypothetical protein
MSDQVDASRDASREAYYDWWVENSPTDHSHHVVYGTRGSIEALKHRLEQAVAEERRALREIIQTVAVLWFCGGGENRPQSALVDEIFAALDVRDLRGRKETP